MKAGALFCGLCALALALTARAGTSLPGSTRPDEDPDADGLVNLEEAEAGTKPLEPDTDGDSLLDGAEAVPTSPAIRAPAAPETNYAIVELGPAEGVCGVNDAGEVLFVAPGSSTGTQTGKFFRKGAVLTIGEGRAGSFAGPMLNGYVLFHAAEETQTTAGNATIRRRVRKFFHPTDFPTPGQSGYATERREWSGPVADPLPETAPASSMLTGLHGQQWAEVWANVRAQLLAQLAGYTPKPGTGIYQTLECELGELNDAVNHTMEARFTLHATYERADPPGEIAFTLHIGMAGWKSVPDTYSAGAWQAVTAGDPASQLPRGLKVNPSLFATAKMGNQTVRFQPWGSDIPLPEIESVIDLGDTISPEGPYLLAATANGTQLLAYNSGNPAGIPVPAPAGGGGGRETTGRKLSNRLVIPTGSGLWRNGRHLPWSRLGGPPSANSTWTAPQITHISPQNHIAAGTVTRLRDANGEPIPEEARQKYAALLLPADLAVDANRDGVIKFAGNPAAAGAYDRTEQSRPFRFWVNDDDDETDGSEKVPVGTPDNQYAFIEGKRDLEDFTRLHISIGGLHEAIVSGTIQIGLEWKNVTGTPAIWVHRAASASGSDDYLKDDTAAEAQIEGVYGVALGKAAHTSPLKIDKAVFQSLSAANPNAYFLFDGAAEGRGRLVMTLWKGSEKIGEGPGVWIDLLDVKKMYVRGQAAPDFQDAPFSHMDSWSPPDIGSQPYENGHPHSKPWDEEKKAVVYVHGINGPWGQADAHASWQADSETMFKRLWHQGFKGRFASFKWLALTPAFPFKFNESEYRGWKCGRGLAQFIGSLPGDYQKNLYSFSQGAIVCGSALTVYQASVHNYVMSQAAAPAGCYDASTAVNSYSDFLNAEASMPTPDSTNDLGYRDYFNGLNVSGSVVSFYNEVDYALKTGTELGINVSWEGNQLLSKPNQNLAGRTYAYDSGPPSGLFAIGQRCFLRDIGPPFNQRRLTDIHESMAFVARPRSEAAGASNAVAGSITSRYNVGPDTASNFRDDSTDHSGQFNRRIQQTQDYYSQLLSALLEE